MKIKLFLSLLVVFLIYSSAYASFPVKRTVTTYETAEVLKNIEDTVTKTTEVYTPVATVAGKDKWVGVALWFFLGWPFAAHRWYYNKPTWANILFILTIGGLGIWAIIDLINMLTDKWN